MLSGLGAVVVMLAVVGALGGFRPKPGGPGTAKPGTVVHQGLFDVQVTNARAGRLKLSEFDPLKNLLLVRMRVTDLGDRSYGITSFMDGVAAEFTPGRFSPADFIGSQGYVSGGQTSTIHPRLPVTIQLVWPLGDTTPSTLTLALREWTYGQSFTTDEFYWSVDKTAPIKTRVTLPVRQGATS